MSTEIFNIAINRVVDVPDEHAAEYLASPGYRKVKKSDYGQADDPPAEAPTPESTTPVEGAPV